MSVDLEKHVFDLKTVVRELENNSKKCEEEERLEKQKCKEAVHKGNIQEVWIHAENAVRQKKQSLNYLKTSARLDAVACKVHSALITRKVTKSMAGMVEAMVIALKFRKHEKFQVLMYKFENEFEDLDVQVTDEAGLELDMELPKSQTGAVGTSEVDDEIAQRLARLRQE